MTEQWTWESMFQIDNLLWNKLQPISIQKEQSSFSSTIFCLTGLSCPIVKHTINLKVHKVSTLQLYKLKTVTIFTCCRKMNYGTDSPQCLTCTWPPINMPTSVAACLITYVILTAGLSLFVIKCTITNINIYGKCINGNFTAEILSWTWSSNTTLNFTLWNVLFVGHKLDA